MEHEAGGYSSQRNWVEAKLSGRAPSVVVSEGQRASHALVEDEVMAEELEDARGDAVVVEGKGVFEPIHSDLCSKECGGVLNKGGLEEREDVGGRELHEGGAGEGGFLFKDPSEEGFDEGEGVVNEGYGSGEGRAEWREADGGREDAVVRGVKEKEGVEAGIGVDGWTRGIRKVLHC